MGIPPATKFKVMKKLNMKWMLATVLSLCIFIAIGMVHGVNDRPLEGEVDDSRQKSSAQLECRGSLNMSLNELGFAVITPQMLLAVPHPDYSIFQVTINHPGSSHDTVWCSQAGVVVEAMVTDMTSSPPQSCWTDLLVEDKIAPIIECDTTYVDCTTDPDNLPSHIAPTRLWDNCTDSANLSLTHYDQPSPVNCHTSPYTFKVLRHYTVTDAVGMTASCTQVILWTKPMIADLMLPADITLDCPSSTDISVTGQPTYNGAPVADLCMIVTSINNQDSIPKCGNSYTLLRQWLIADWCASDVQYYTQKIHVLDTVPPVLTCPGPQIVPATINCQAHFNIINPSVSDNCSDPSDFHYIYKVDGIASPTRNVSLDLGTYTITVVVRDACYNYDSCHYQVTVQDQVNPYCGSVTSFVTVPLNAMGMAILDTTQLNSSFLDNCGLASVEIRRMTDNCGVPGNTIFGPSVKFCCADVGSVQIEIRLTDIHGNVGYCMITAIVQDHTATSLTCPPNRTVSCNTLDPDLHYGTPTVTNVCGYSLDSLIIRNQNACGTGSITKRYYVTDSRGNVDSCDQTITINGAYLLQPSDIVWPTSPVVLDDCNPDTTSATLGEPIISISAPCGDARASYVDQYLSPDSACSVINRIWTVTDLCNAGNSFSRTQVIIIRNNRAPIISVPANVTVSTNPTDCMAQVDLSAVLFDDCSTDVTVTNNYNNQQGDIDDDFPCGITTIIFTVTNKCGLSTTGSTIVTVEDNTPPTFDTPLPGNMTIECPGDTTIANTGIATASDNCPLSLNVTYIDVVSPGSCANVFTVTRTWTATDKGNNTATHVQVIQVQDLTPPTISCPDAITVNCNEGIDPSTTGQATAIDQCNPAVAVTYTDASVVGFCAGGMVITRTWRAEDDCGRVATCDQRIVRVDQIIPVITDCPNDITVSCNESTDPLFTGNPTYTDMCDPNPTPSYTDVSVGAICPGGMVITRTWIVTDACGNVSHPCTQRITMFDDIDPIITIPSDKTKSCEVGGDPAQTGFATATDMCDPNPQILYTDVTTPGTCPEESIITRTWTAVDSCGNLATGVQTITIVDDTQPVITCPATITINCDESDLPANTGSATATDNCDPNPDVTFVDAVTPGVCTGEEVIMRTWTAEDNCGNVDVCTQTIIKIDTTKPVIICPSSIAVSCTASILPAATGTATATDNCTTNPSVTFTDSVEAGTCPQEMTIFRKWNAIDDCSNASQCIQVITVEDNEAPTLTCPVNLTVECPADTTTGNTGLPGVLDNCGTPTFSYTDNVTPGSCPSEFTVVRTWTAQDECGNVSASCDQTIEVVDNSDPIIVCPSDLTVDCNADTSVAATGTATATDLCVIGLTVTYVQTVIPNLGNGFTITRVWQVNDGCGNQDQCTQTITVSDLGAPVITCPADQVVTCEDLDLTFDYGDATVVDDCGATITSVIIDNRNACSVGDVIKRFYATDGAGRVDSCDQTITVLPSSLLTLANIAWPADHDITTCSPDTSAAALGSPTVTFNSPCGNIDVSYSDTYLSPDSVCSVVNRVWTVQDLCNPGNIFTHTQEIIIRNNRAPIISVPASITVTADDDCEAIVDLAAVTVDDCSTVASITNNFNGQGGDIDATFGCGIFPITFTVTNICGLSTTGTTTVTVEDNTNPTFITDLPDLDLDCPGDTSVLITGIPVVDDNCRVDSLYKVDNVNPGACEGVFSLVRTWVVVDKAGNTNQQFQIIEVVDETNPLLTCPDDLTLACDADTSVAATGMATATDECNADPVVTYTQVVATIADGFVITRNWTAIDACGNDTTCTQTITVNGSAAPALDCPNDTIIDCNDALLPLSQFGIATASSACGPVGTVTSSSVTNVNSCGVGTVTRTFSVDDGSGGTITCDQVITIELDPIDSADFTYPPATSSVFSCTSLDDITIAAPSLNAGVSTCGTHSVSNVRTVDSSPAATGCVDIIYDFTITDDCAVLSGLPGTWTYTAVISVFDTDAPVFAPFTTPISAFASPTTCDAAITMSDAVATDCNSVTITNNSPHATNGGANASGSYPEGTTTVTFTATDACGNAETLDIQVIVTDTVAPTFRCIKNEYHIQENDTVIVPISVTTTDLFDNCTDVDDLILTFDLNDFSDTVQVFTCDDVSPFTYHVVTYIIDGSGNVDSCETVYGIGDMNGFCTTPIIVGGQVSNIYNEPVLETRVLIENDVMNSLDMTDESGHFDFSGLTAGLTHKIEARKEGEHIEGLTAQDLSVLSRMIARIEDFDHPLQHMAADVNGDGKANVLDVLAIKKLLLGYTNDFGEMPVWNFYDAHFDLSDMNNPLGRAIPEYVMAYNMNQNMMDADFIAVKLGDIDQSFVQDFDLAVDRNENSSNINAEIEELSNGNYSIRLITNKPEEMVGGQFEVVMDSKLVTLKEVQTNEAIGLDQDYSNVLSYRNSQAVRFVWTEEIAMTEGVVLAEVTVEAASINDVVETLSMSKYFFNESFDQSDVKYQLALTKEIVTDETTGAESTFELFQNVPNPFESTTAVSFQLPQNEEFVLEVYNSNGQSLYQVTDLGKAGINTITISDKELGSQSGILLYRLTTEDNSALRKMMMN